MRSVERAYGRGREWAGRNAPVVFAALLALLAVAESILHARHGSGLFLSETVTVPAGTGIPHTGDLSEPGGTLPQARDTLSQAGEALSEPGGALPQARDVLSQADTFPAAGPGSALRIVIFPLLALATTLPLALLWSRPVAAGLLVSGAGLLSIGAFSTFTVGGLVAQLVAGYRFGGPPWRAILLTVPFPLLGVLLDQSGSTGVLPLLTLLPACLAPAAALAGIARRARRQARADTAARQVIADSLLEHTARGERARIARELHDVVAHHISMVAVQAETARLAVPGMPAAGAERLLAIGDTARAALTEMRRLLGVLRDDAEAETAFRPQPGLRLDELNRLLDESREASGSGTRLILRGTPVELDPGVELAAYRIIQEALTNARRHAPGAAVDVELDYTGQTLHLLVRDNGPGPPDGTAAGGHGLTGMRERAAAVGGELRTGPAPGGGFLLEARLPGKDAG